MLEVVWDEARRLESDCHEALIQHAEASVVRLQGDLVAHSRKTRQLSPEVAHCWVRDTCASIEGARDRLQTGATLFIMVRLALIRAR